jgi:4-amino-4-deoxy-L-arabinose transferase-like glycosyltransferase
MASEASRPVSARITRSSGRHGVGRGPAVWGPPQRADQVWSGYPVRPQEPSDPDNVGPPRLRGSGWSARRRYLPLTVICTIQVALALPLAWRNTAFTDEADYLWLGRLVVAHWLHGTSWPTNYGHRVLSGSPLIYPPLGAIANSIGGLAGARILSLLFMLGGTILLYFAATALFGRTVGIFATAVWATTEPVFRLTFATYDAMSVFLVALAAWLAVQAGWRHRAGLFLASGAALALANATAYSSAVIDPVVLVFAFLVLLARIARRRAVYWTAGFVAVWLAFFCLLITVSGSWAGISFTILNRHVQDHQPLMVILGATAEYSGFVIIAALAGAVIAMRAERRRRPLLLLLGASALLVPTAHLVFHTAWALDKHLALGIWFASMAAGYGCLMAVQRVMRAVRSRRGILVGAGILAMLGLLAADWQLASLHLHKWANTTSFVAAFRPLAARTSGPIFASAEQRVAEYYTPQGSMWWLWQSRGIPLHPRVPRKRWYEYYQDHVAAAKYGLIALFYVAPKSVPALSRGTAPGARGGKVYAELARLRNFRGNELGVPTLTHVLEHDRAYRLVAVGPYGGGAQPNGIFAIWLRSAPSRRSTRNGKTR